MARNRTLLTLLDDLRAECRMSPNPAHHAQQRETQVRVLQRMQDFLYEDFPWPHLRVERTFPVAAGQRYYSLPDDIALERVQHLEVRYATRWIPLESGIGPAQYAASDSDLDQRQWPPRRWRIWEDDRIEIWPVPDQNGDPAGLEGMVKVVGIRNLRPFRDDNDAADLDDRLIVLYAAAEMLGAAGGKDAKLKLDQAQQRYATLRSELTPRRRVQLFGSAPQGVPLRGMPAIDYRPANK